MSKVVPEERAAAREHDIVAREGRVVAREAVSDEREVALEAREEGARLRDEALQGREEADQAREQRERLVLEMRRANENLVLATVRAQESAEEAEAARAAMAASEERFRSLVTASAAIVFQGNAAGTIRVDPASWTSFTGLELTEHDRADAWGWLLGVHPDDRDLVRAAWTRSVATGSMYTQQHRLRRMNGTYAWVVARAVPIPRTGPPREWIGMMTDVSDRIRIDEAREQFIAILGHDLRNPVSAIKLATYLLAGTDLADPLAQAVDRIAKSAQRMDTLIRDVLDFARGRLGQGIPIKRKSCDLGRIVLDEVDQARHAHPDRAISCEVTGDVSGDWDPDRVQQAVSNLISNAIQHGDDPTLLSVRSEGDSVSLSIHNQGATIPPAIISMLFEPFRHREEKGPQGLGLGLYIVSEIVRAHGGSISVSSPPGHGTTFTTIWPRSG